MICKSPANYKFYSPGDMRCDTPMNESNPNLDAAANVTDRHADVKFWRNRKRKGLNRTPDRSLAAEKWRVLACGDGAAPRAPEWCETDTSKRS